MALTGLSSHAARIGGYNVPEELMIDPCYAVRPDHKAYTSADSPVTLTLTLSGILIEATSGDITFNLPNISSVGACVKYRFISGARGQTITIDPGSSDKIVGGNKYGTGDVTDGGALTWITKGPGEFIELQSGTDWNVQAVYAYSWVVA